MYELWGELNNIPNAKMETNILGCLFR